VVKNKTEIRRGVLMAEILVRAQNVTHPDAEKDRRGCYKIGYPVVVMPDGHPWGNEERLPKFVVIKIPGVSIATVKKYIGQQYDDTKNSDGVYPVYRRRLWRIRVADMPIAARNKLSTDGVLTIKAGTYSGAYDYTWAQVKGYFRNQKTNLDETADI
jgi:hypothetical protein